MKNNLENENENKNDNENKTNKKIINIIDEQIKDTNVKIKSKKIPTMRVETHTWNIEDEELDHRIQFEMLNNIYNNLIDVNNKKYISTFMSNLKTKMGSYKQQDLLKKKYNSEHFVSFREILRLLVESELKCHYCHEEIYILYKQVREMSQWSLDRIDNELGHNHGNLVIACLKCNLKRRRINKNSFMFTRNMVIVRENYIKPINYDFNCDYDHDLNYDNSNNKIIQISDNC